MTHASPGPSRELSNRAKNARSVRRPAADARSSFLCTAHQPRTILRTGQKLTGLGTVSLIAFGQGFGSAVSNNHGEVLSFITTTAGNGYLVKATPK